MREGTREAANNNNLHGILGPSLVLNWGVGWTKVNALAFSHAGVDRLSQRRHEA